MEGPPPPHHPPILALAFTSRGAAALRADASRTLTAGGAAAAALVVVTALLWRAQRRGERLAALRERERRLAVLGEMSAVLAHEIRNPLASLKGHAQLLEELLPEGRPRDKAARVVREAERLEALSGDLLDFARSGPIERREVDPVALLREAAEDVGAAARLRLDAGGAPERVALDPRRMRQVLGNVIGNALQASPEGAPVAVSVAREAGALVYRVRDHGPGLPPGAEARIFEPFFTTRTRGTGLGLAVAARLVALHGGRVAARTHPEGGAEITIHLPPAGGAPAGA